MSFTTKILIAMGAGILVGLLFSTFDQALQLLWPLLIDGLFRIVGDIFIALLQMVVVPLVLVSLICGVTSLGDLRTLGRVGAKTLGLYLVTTAVAIVLALTLSSILAPGAGFELIDDVTYEASEPPALADVLINMVPENPVAALAEAEMLQIIVFALLFGFALTQAGRAGERVAAFFSDVNEVVMGLVLIVIKAAPIGVFALIARTFATQGIEIFVPLADYFIAVILTLLLHLLLTYTSLVRLVGLSATMFLKKMRAVMTFAFSTSSSSATIPLTLNTLERRLGVDNSVASFTVPLGATINMDGTAIMQGAATVFIANVYGIDLTLGDFLTVILTATLASIGTAAVPSAGLIMLAMVLGQVGLPVEGIALIIGIDRLLDMLRTALNVCGDAAVTLVVARTEKAFDGEIFDDPSATLDHDVAHAHAVPSK